MQATTFLDNMSLPIHRWYRYSAGFSAQWVQETVLQQKLQNKSGQNFIVLDPFAGSGTTLLACDSLGIQSYGYESHPFVYNVALAKLSWEVDIHEFVEKANFVLQTAKANRSMLYDYPSIVYRCYDEQNLQKIDRLRKAVELVKDDSIVYRLIWMAFISIIRSTSHAGTATWQYVLPNKQKTKVADAYDAFWKQVDQICADVQFMQWTTIKSKATLFLQDARSEKEELEDKISFILTSPPYANNYDYGDATRLELSVLGEINTWGDLQNSVRTNLVRSCSQMVSKEKKDTYSFLADKSLFPIYDEILDVCRRLDIEKENHGGKKNYHTMIALYFLDLANVWIQLRKVCKKDNSEICFVIGDSAPYGIYVPVDEWLGRLALNAGFKSYEFHKTRDRNIKWKNRKHSVPLKEGLLWVKG